MPECQAKFSNEGIKSGNTYPQLWQPVATQFEGFAISQPLAGLLSTCTHSIEISHSTITPEELLSNFSFRHFIALMRIKEPLKRAFYEKEAIKGQW